MNWRGNTISRKKKALSVADILRSMISGGSRNNAVELVCVSSELQLLDSSEDKELDVARKHLRKMLLTNLKMHHLRKKVFFAQDANFCQTFAKRGDTQEITIRSRKAV